MRDCGARSCLLILTSLSLMFVAAPAMAESLTLNAGASDALRYVSAEAPSDRWRYTVGLGAAVVPDYEGSENYELVPLPVARVQKGYRYGQLFGLKLSSNLVQHPNYRAGLVLNFRPKRNDVENNNVAKQNAVDEALEVGVQLGYDLQLDDGVLGAQLELVQDAIDGHDGGLITPEINYRRPLGDQWTMRLATSITYATHHYMNSYFGVSPLEAGYDPKAVHPNLLDSKWAYRAKDFDLDEAKDLFDADDGDFEFTNDDDNIDYTFNPYGGIQDKIG